MYQPSEPSFNDPSNIVKLLIMHLLHLLVILSRVQIVTYSHLP